MRKSSTGTTSTHGKDGLLHWCQVWNAVSAVQGTVQLQHPGLAQRLE